MNFTESDRSGKSVLQKGIKRRNFLSYLGISAVSVFFLSKLPGKLFSSAGKTAISESKRSGKPSIIVKENPFAVKRSGKSKDVNNNG